MGVLEKIHPQNGRKRALIKNFKFLVPREGKETHMKPNGNRNLTLSAVRK